MKSWLPLIVALVVGLLYTTEYAAAEEKCRAHNCVKQEQCDHPVRGISCPEEGKICCSVIRSEFRTHCDHHGGECMQRCATALQRSAVDCSGDEVCCVLVA